MDRPDVALKTYLDDAAVWTLATAGATHADIVFTTTDWTDKGSYLTGKPHVVAKLAGWDRLQEAEETLHRFTLILQVAIHCPDKTEATLEAKKNLQWAIGQFAKQLMDGLNSSKISGWDYAIAQMGAFADAVEVLPEDLVLNITVLANIAWSA